MLIRSLDVKDTATSSIQYTKGCYLNSRKNHDSKIKQLFKSHTYVVHAF